MEHAQKNDVISLDKKIQRIQAKSCYFILDAGYHSLCGQDLMIVMINKSYHTLVNTQQFIRDFRVFIPKTS